LVIGPRLKLLASWYDGRTRCISTIITYDGSNVTNVNASVRILITNVITIIRFLIIDYVKLDVTLNNALIEFPLKYRVIITYLIKY